MSERDGRCNRGVFAVALVFLVFLGGCPSRPNPAERYRATDKFIGAGARMKIGPNVLELEIPKGGKAAGLTFPTESRVTLVEKDGTLLTDREGATAVDAAGAQWVSRRVDLDGRSVFAFFR